METKDKPVLSASKINKFLECSWAYYCTYVFKLPDETHPKTRIGTLVHAILEWLSSEKHKDKLSLIVSSKTIYACKPIGRAVKYFQQKYSLDSILIADVDDLVFVALNNDFMYEGAKKVFSSEYEFKIEFDEIIIRGFIDRMAEFDDKFKVRDYKTAKAKFKPEDLKDNIQASVYQLAIWNNFQKPAEVEFNFVRHKKNPLCIVAPKSPIVLDGFKTYLNHLGASMKAVTEKTAKNNLLAEENSGFCLRVCKFKDPFYYYHGLDAKGHFIASSKNEKELKKDSRVLTVVKKQYNGCPYFHEK